jgi:hypothetical protein
MFRSFRVALFFIGEGKAEFTTVLAAFCRTTSVLFDNRCTMLADVFSCLKTVQMHPEKMEVCIFFWFCLVFEFRNL